MKAHETERDINIQVFDDTECTGNLNFDIILCDDVTQQQIKGGDTRCTVTIIDNEKSGTIMFTDDVVNVRPNSSKVEVTLKRVGGADGEVTVKVSTRPAVES